MIVALASITYMVSPYVMAVIMGGILALLSYPVYRELRKRRVSPNIAATLVTLGVVLLVIVPISAFAILAIKQAIVVGEKIATNDNFTVRAIFDRLAAVTPIEAVIGSPEQLERQARGWIQGAGKTATAMVLAVAANVPNLLLQLALATLACFFFLLDGKTFLGWMRDKVPLDQDVRANVVSSFQNTAVSIIWATLAAATAQAVAMLLGFWALGVPAAFLAAGATFIFAWIPVVGSVPVWIAGAVYLYTQGSVPKAIIMVAVGLFIGVIDNFVRPIVLKGRGNMHPLVSLVAIFGGVGLFGMIGVFIGPILAAIAISLLQAWPSVARRFGLMTRDQQIEPVKAPSAARKIS